MLSTVTALKVISMLQCESLFTAARSTGKPRSAPSRGVMPSHRLGLLLTYSTITLRLRHQKGKAYPKRAQVMQKKVVPATPTQAKDLRSYFKAGPSPRLDPSEATTSAPVIGPRVGTRHLLRFDVNKEPSLVRFQAYLHTCVRKAQITLCCLLQAFLNLCCITIFGRLPKTGKPNWRLSYGRPRRL